MIPPALIAACSAGSDSLKARAARIKSMGFSAIKPESKMWVQGQLAHIGMNVLKTGDGDIRATYQRLRKSADQGELFMTDIEEYAFSNANNTMHISLNAAFGDDPGCSVAFAKNIEIPLRTRQTWTSNAGTFTEYHIDGNRYAMASTFTAPWDKWIKGRRLVSAFLVVTQ